MDTTKDNKKDEEILEIAHKRFMLASEAEYEIRRESLEDLEFRSGKQWPDEIKSARDIQQRPCITVNRLPQFVRQVTNDQRQNRPAIKVSPVDDNADIDTAKIMQGLIRHIEYNSGADIAYDTAFEGAVTHGFGYFRVLTDFVNPMSFDQEILIKKVTNAFSVYLDPYYTEPDGSDANWGFIFEKVSKEDYKEMYGDTELASMNDWNALGDNNKGWASDNSCRIAEYFYKEYSEETIVMLRNGKTLLKSNYEDMKEKDLVNDPNFEVVQERKTRIHKVIWCKLNAVEVMEKREWVGSFIPIIPVLGDCLNVDGEKKLEGIVRHAKDSQRMLNYWVSNETETITLAPKAPFIIAEGQIEGHEEQWNTANTKNHSALQYKPTSIAGKPVAPPQRNMGEPPIMAITNARSMASDDLKATTGIYDAAMGSQSNETSGIAIQRRNVQSQTSNFHYIDNLTRSLRHCGRIIIEIIPKVYDVPRAIRIIGEDDEEKIVRIQETFQEKGKDVLYNFSKGKYDVTVETGPSFTTKRQEATESMIAMSQHNPKFTEVAGDLMVKNMDWPGAQEISERLKKTLPPGIAEQDNDKMEVPPQVQAQMQQMNQMIEQLTENLNTANEQLKTDSIKLESNERIAFAKIEADLKKTMFNAESSESEIMLKEEINLINKRLENLGSRTPITTGGVSPGQNMENNPV